MSKLEEYRDNKALSFHPHQRVFFEKGFNAVLSLDLSTKFLHWIDYHTISHAGYEPHRTIPSPVDNIYRGRNYEELFQYWVTHIFKIE